MAYLYVVCSSFDNQSDLWMYGPLRSVFPIPVMTDDILYKEINN